MEQIFGGGILWTLLIGFLAGLLARALKPGEDKLGFFMTSCWASWAHCWRASSAGR